MSEEPLETTVAVIRALQDTHHEQLAEIRSRLKRIEDAQHETNTRLASVNWCPKPGSCIPLTLAVEAHDNRLRSLEDSRTEARASGKVIAALLVGSGALSGLVGVAISKLWR